MFLSIVFALAATAPSPQPQCDPSLINETLRQSEVADYVAKATPPPPAISAELYARVADSVAECADAPQHFMDSEVRDLLQAANFATLSGQAYFEAHDPSKACVALHRANEYFTKAYAAHASSNLDNVTLQADRQHVAALRQLLSSKCPG